MLNYFLSRFSILFVSEPVICDFAIDFSEHWLLKIFLIPIPFFHLPVYQQCDALKCPSPQIFSLCFPKEYIIWWRLKKKNWENPSNPRQYMKVWSCHLFWFTAAWKEVWDLMYLWRQRGKPTSSLLRLSCNQLGFIWSLWPWISLILPSGIEIL